MNSLSELTSILSPVLPVETGVFSSKARPTYAVLTPIVDTDALHTDNLPEYEVQEVRISIFTKSNYIQTKNRISKLVLRNGFVITEKRYIGHEDDTGYYHYAIDVAKQYESEDI